MAELKRGRATTTVVVEEPDTSTEGGLGHDPLSAEELLQATFYRAPDRHAADRHAADRHPADRHGRRAVTAPPAEKPKPTHYKVVSISLYQEDIERLETMVAELKRRGHTKANKSQLIRFALDTVDIDKLPRGY